MLKQYLKYKRFARGAHKIHSPFVYDFFKEVLMKSKNWNDRQIHALKRQLKRDHDRIEVNDLGAGSKKDNGKKRSVSSIAKHAAIERKYGKLLSCLIDHYELEYIVELGTSLGVGTSYLASPESVKKVISVEGSPEIHEIAEKNIRKLGLENVQLMKGEFSEVLDQLIEAVPQIDLVFIDGNHTYEATKAYFDFFLKHAHNDTFLVFDDINWSNEMRRAWDEIKSDPAINVSLEFFRMGMVIKREEQQKEHFVLRF